MTSTMVNSKTRAHLQWHSVVRALSELCQSEAGVARAMALDTESDLRLIERRLDETSEARQLIDENRALSVGALVDVRDAAFRAARGSQIEGESLVYVGRLLETSRRVNESSVELIECPNLQDVCANLHIDQQLEYELIDMFDENFELVAHASPELRRLRQRTEECRGQLKKILNRYLTDEDILPMLQEDYFTLRDERFVLPLKARHKNHVEGIVHGWSKTGSTVYVEPVNVIEANNRLMLAHAEVDAEVSRILGRLSNKVGNIANELAHNFERLTMLDLIFARGRFSKHLDATRPIMAQDGTLQLKAFRHPLLILDDQRVIPNDLRLTKQQSALVITGPNTGGKTVALKSAGLLVMMAHAGLHIPAKHESIVPLAPKIFSDIGDEQSLEARHSTFSGHIHNLNQIIDQLVPGSLVLLDELVVGTDPSQGAALAQALAEYFVEKECLLIITTHYENLKCLALDNEHFRNAAMGLESTSSQPTYTLTLDVPGASSALITAERLGLPSDIIERAGQLTDPNQRHLHTYLVRLDELQNELQTKLKTVESLRQDLKKQERTLDARSQRLDAREQKIKSNVYGTLLSDAQALRETVQKQTRLIRRHSNDAKALNDAKSVAQKAIDHVFETRNSEKLEQAGPEISIHTLSIGQRVFVVSLQRHGIIESIDTKKKRCDIRLGTMTSRISAADIRQPESTKKDKGERTLNHWKQKDTGTERAVTTSDLTDWSQVGPQTSANTVDLRGLTVEECLEKAKKFIDGCYLRNESAAYFIHGHGGGQLKRAVRTWLEASQYATGQRPGDRYEGGDGVTVARLR